MMRLDSIEPVAEDAQAHVARLLGVELDAGDVAALDGGGERHAVASWWRRDSATTGAA